MSDPVVIMTNVRLPRDLHDTLRKIALERHTTLQWLLLEGARTVAAAGIDDAMKAEEKISDSQNNGNPPPYK